MKKLLTISTPKFGRKYILVQVLSSDHSEDIFKRVTSFCDVNRLNGPIFFRKRFTLEDKMVIKYEYGAIKILLVDYDARGHEGFDFIHPLEVDTSNLEELLRVLVSDQTHAKPVAQRTGSKL